MNNDTDGIQGNGAGDDPDDDGLLNFDEYLNGSDPSNGDTDGDGVWDSAEVAQGSDPADASDNGQPPPPEDILELPFRIYGDWAAWEMTVEGRGPSDLRVFKLSTDAPGGSATAVRKLHKGNSYRLTMSWLGSGTHTDPYWYCWEAKIGGLPTQQAYGNPSSVDTAVRIPGAATTVAGEGWFADNADGLLTSHVHSNGDGSGNVAEGLEAILYVPKVDLKIAYSDQLPDREANPLPPTVSGQDTMYMGARSDNKGYIKVDVDVLPEMCAEKVRVGVRKMGATTVLASAAVQAGGKTSVEFSNAGNFQRYEVVAGVDADSDGALQNSEVSEVMPDQFVLVTQSDYNWSWGVLNTGAFFPGVGGDLLDAFIDDAVPTGANSTLATITAAALTHPLGAQWTASCDAQTRRYTYAEGSSVSDAVETTGTVEDGLRTNLDQHQAEVQDFFTQNPAVNEQTFGPWTWNIKNVKFGEIAHPSLHFAFGHVSIAGIVSVTVRRSDLKVTSIQYTGSFDDIYDFAYDGAYPSVHGATVQTGFPTLGTGGRVFWTRVEFERQTSNFNHDFN